jgi:hypothetical protein
VELLRIRALWGAAASARLGFVLVAGASLLVSGGLIHLHWAHTRT